jgi:CubicO group peptidase (beta-lactamase class C family)
VAVRFDSVEEQVSDAIRRGAFPGAVVLVRDADRVFYLRAFGDRSVEPARSAMQEGTIFDLSSLTKALATSVAVMCLVRDGKLRLDDRVTRYFHNFGVHGKTHVTFRHLLSHCSGLPAWRPYYKSILQVERKGGRINFLGSQAAKEWVYQQVERERPEAPPGQTAIYSDLGFILLGAVVEAVSGGRLDRFCQERIFRPLGLRALGFVDLSALRSRRVEPNTDMIAPTQRCPWRHRVLCGEVDDDNAFAMGGIAGHAGLFGSARDIDVLLCRLRDSYLGREPFLPRAIVREFWRRDGTVSGSTWALGFDTPSPRNSAAGSLFGPETIGHLGFTGVSFWLDLLRERHVVLLTNRVHPSRDNDAIREFRPLIHDLINQALGS